MKRTSEEVIKMYQEATCEEGNMFSYLNLKESISLVNIVKKYNKIFTKTCRKFKNSTDTVYNEYFISFSSKENESNVKVLHCVIRNCDEKIYNKLKDHSYYTYYSMKDYIKPMEIYYELQIADSANQRDSHTFFFYFDVHDTKQLVELLNYNVHCKSIESLENTKNN